MRNDCHWLFKSVLLLMLQFDHKCNEYLSIMGAFCSFLNCRQSQEQTIREYLESLTLWANTIEYHGGTFSKTTGSQASSVQMERQGLRRNIGTQRRMKRSHWPSFKEPIPLGTGHSSPSCRTNLPLDETITQQTSTPRTDCLSITVRHQTPGPDPHWRKYQPNDQWQSRRLRV